MITPEKIKSTADGWWADVLRSYNNGSNYFPKEIGRITRIKPSDTIQRFSEITKEIDLLQSHSKDKTGKGYSILWDEVKNLKVGKNRFPRSVVFETLDDYLVFLNKKKQFAIFVACRDKIRETFPELMPWFEENPTALISHHESIEDIIKVCEYFKANPSPKMYRRQLPIDVHTKFIEENESIITSLLNILIADHLNQGEKTFERKFNLLYDQTLVRIRFLDKDNFPQYPDVTIPLKDFINQEIKCTRVIVTENKMNFLTMPPLRGTVAIWSGGGFNIKYLKDVAWMQSKEINYWGDIDPHGFLILDQMRGYYKQTKSMLMDSKTITEFKLLLKPGKKLSRHQLSFLSAEEREAFEYVQYNSLRLEQERILK